MSNFTTTDYWAIITLQTCGYVPEDIEAKILNEGRNCQLTFHFPEEAKEVYDKWLRGSPEGELATIRKVKEYIENFKQNLYRFNPRV